MHVDSDTLPPLVLVALNGRELDNICEYLTIHLCTYVHLSQMHENTDHSPTASASSSNNF